MISIGAFDIKSQKRKGSNMKKIVSILVICAISLSLFAGCGNASGKDSRQTSGDNSAAATQAEPQVTSKEAKNVTLTHLTWRVPDVADAFDVFVKKYQDEHPNITMDIKNIASDQYSNTLKTRLLSGDPPDIITTGAGSEYNSQVRNGYILDITDEPMIENIQPGTLSGSMVDGRIYGVPYDLVSLVVLYNKKIFADNGLKMPTNYPEMLQVCETLKSNNITPAAYGIKDSYVTQFLPYQIAPTAVYAKNTNWDTDLTEGKVKFNSPEWKRTFAIPFDFQKKGYFTPNALGVGDQQSVEMFARGDAAMTFTGTWAVSVARAANPELDLGMFPFPANEPGEEAWMTMSLGQIMAISKTGKYIDEAKEYLAAWTNKDYAQLWTDRAKATSTIKGVNNNFDPSVNDLVPYLEKLKAWQFANVGWPAGVTELFIKKFQEVYTGKVTIDEMLDEMDKVVKK